MFKTVRGCQVSNLDGIHEEYWLDFWKGMWVFTINISAEHIDKVFRDLCSLVRVPAFFLLEHGTLEEIEQNLRKSEADPFHKDVYYLDGLDYSSFIKIFDPCSELLFNDGMSNFGFGSHQGMDEVYVGKYKIFKVYTDDPKKYETKLSQLGFVKVEQMKTVWDNFSEETPGVCYRIEVDGIGVYELVKRLEKYGLYFAERREE